MPCLWAFLLILILLFPVAEAKQPQVVIETAKKNVIVSVEVADTPATRAHGLMFRHQIPENSGMLFVFPEPSQSPFWMKNTLIPLDMIFIGGETSLTQASLNQTNLTQAKVVDVIEQTTPLSEGLLIPKHAYTLVLEVNAGFVKRQSIHLGDRVTGDYVIGPQKGPESRPIPESKPAE